MRAYTMLGEFDWGGDLLVDRIGVDWSEEQVQREADALGCNGWSDTLEADSAEEALQAAGAAYCDETHRQCPAKLFDVRSGRQLVYEGRALAEQEQEQEQ
ncbi:hypothetical protein AB0I84_20880 [Streptomyces spectabilis]|uniref:hypothetical protein n=1 Tax=Streptomyces spectabilis TaxID=68270 RepID=UPI0033DCEB0B